MLSKILASAALAVTLLLSACGEPGEGDGGMPPPEQPAQQ